MRTLRSNCIATVIRPHICAACWRAAWPRKASRAHRAANSLGARYGTDIPARQSPNGRGIELLSATLLFQCDAALLFGYPAIGVPHRAPCLPVFSIPYHQRCRRYVRGVCDTASSTVESRELASARAVPPFVLE